MDTVLWNTLLGFDSSSTLAENLKKTSYSALIQYHYGQDQCNCFLRGEGKLKIPIPSGSYRELYAYAASNLIHPQDRSRYRDWMEPARLLARLSSPEARGMARAEFRMKTTDGNWRWAAHMYLTGTEYGVPDGVIFIYIYDTQVQKEQEEISPALNSFSGVQRDELTGLMMERDFFALAQERLPRLHGHWCVIDVDIEHYKLFTDWYGLEAGQKLLARFGGILNEMAEALGGLAGYRGQDDFCLLIPYDRAAIEELFVKLKTAISALGGMAGFTPLLGVCMIDESCHQILEAFNHAALTTEDLKNKLDEHIKVYNGEQHRKQAEEFRILADFQHAIEHNEITFYLQPQCRISTRQIVGAESMARWRKADGTMISPAVFVPILEKYGIVPQLDKYIWKSVCQWLRKWMDAGHLPIPVSVNVSRIDLFSMDVPMFFAELIQKYDLPVQALKIEITESAYTDDTSKVNKTVKKLRDMGFLVYMDDFGSGYSSLNMLRSMNVDVIKLDAQFLSIKEQEERKGISILESVVNMAKNMAIPIIVEGVESSEQMQFVSDLGCRYMQGYFFYRPMPVPAFETLMEDERLFDPSGITFKANQQLHIREFMDENIYSDAMLNNILGPVAFYCWKGENVDIIRYNQQFYQMVGIGVEQMNLRQIHIQDYLFPEDRRQLFQMLETAYHDRLNGVRGIVRVYKPNNTLVWLALQIYFMDENEQGKRFYTAAQDVTELQYINSDLPGGYYRLTLDEGFEFQYLSQNFRDMTGFSVQEIKDLFGNKLINMVHPQDQKLLLDQADAMMRGKLRQVHPFRIQRKQGDYIYLAEQAQLTDLFGPTCWQCMAVDVTEVMNLRNQMRVLVKYSSDSIIFIHSDGGHLVYKVAVHGLEKQMGLDKNAFESALNDGRFKRWISPDDGNPCRRLSDVAHGRVPETDYSFTVAIPQGPALRLTARIDQVRDDHYNVDFILALRLA